MALEVNLRATQGIAVQSQVDKPSNFGEKKEEADHRLCVRGRWEKKASTRPFWHSHTLALSSSVSTSHLLRILVSDLHPSHPTHYTLPSDRHHARGFHYNSSVISPSQIPIAIAIAIATATATATHHAIFFTIGCYGVLTLI